MPIDPDKKFYIIELGTGSGKFSYFMLKAMLEMKETMGMNMDNIVYVMTDFTESNFQFWKDHPALKPFVESGQVSERSERTYKDAQAWLVPKTTPLVTFVVALTVSLNFTRFAFLLLSRHLALCARCS